MSRHGYSDDLHPLELGRWRGQVASAIRGQRGQALLRELRDALDAMPERRLVADVWECDDGGVCALAALAQQRGVDLSGLSPENHEEVGEVFGIAHQLAQELMFLNDERYPTWQGIGRRVDLAMGRRYGPVEDTERRRWRQMRAWVDAHVQP